MSIKAFLPLVIAAFVLTACGGAPGKSEVQGAIDRLAASTPILFGTDKPIVKDAKCTKAGDGMYNCVASLATSSDPQPMTINVRLTKLSGKWQAQISGLGGIG